MSTPPRRILPLIVLSQFLCVSIWFAGNAVMGDLLSNFQLPDHSLALLTSAVQLGFIVGTLVFAVLSLADRFSPTWVFFLSAIAGGIFNLGMLIPTNTLWSLALLRFFTGLSLAGIYPVGMKIAADYYKEGLGKSLGLLVGALVLGTGFPHLIQGFSFGFPWRTGVITTSALALAGGILMRVFVPNGPHRVAGKKWVPASIVSVFKNKQVRAAAFGYFGHMWELYAFWAFVPIILSTYQEIFPMNEFSVSVWSFFIIGIGGLASATSGYISERMGAQKTAIGALALSGICCLLSICMFAIQSPVVLLGFLLIWGWVVVADSAMFSTLVAENSSPQTTGTALTIVNSIGFAISILSIQVIAFLQTKLSPEYVYIILALGPVLGLWAMIDKHKVPE